MTERPILRLADARPAQRKGRKPDRRPRPLSRGAAAQGLRLGKSFDHLEEVLAGEDSEVVLRGDPGGIAPERALVFVTAVPIANFVGAAGRVGLEVLAEVDLGAEYELDGELVLEHSEAVSPTLYATMPTRESLKRLLQLWRGYQRGKQFDKGYAPWKALFDMLDDLRPWGPEDRISPETRAELEECLRDNDASEIRLELEIVPTRDREYRERWRGLAERRVRELGGRVLSHSSIEEEGFVYEALLVGMGAYNVREMLRNPGDVRGLATLDGLQFVLSQVVANSTPRQSDPLGILGHELATPYQNNVPLRGVLLDGTPAAGHKDLDGGVVIEDVHDLVRLSVVSHRRHATSMASLILRGDLLADGAPVRDSRLLCVPVLVDAEGGAWSPEDRLFVDLVHVALTRIFAGGQPLGTEAFVVNFSVGIRGANFAGRISSLARLLDWWAHAEGVLFVVSSGNVPIDLRIGSKTLTSFESATLEERKEWISSTQRASRHERTLLAPSEALNVLTVGAVSADLAPTNSLARSVEVSIQEENETPIAISSAHGPGPFGAVKPDMLAVGGRHEVRAIPDGGDLKLRVIEQSVHSGLYVAAAGGGNGDRRRDRGTSCAAALTTRAILNAAAAISAEDGPYAGQELSRRDLSLLTRALAVNASRWPEAAHLQYIEERGRLGSNRHLQAKAEVARHYGHGVLDPNLMCESPRLGATLIGVGSIRKDAAQVFEVPLPSSMPGDSVPRSMFVTLAWFSPMEPRRARYRLAALEAFPSSGEELESDSVEKGWCLGMKGGHLDGKMINRGTLWSRRMVHDRKRVPEFEEGATLPIRVQCRDASGGGLDRDENIRFAIAVTLEVNETVQYDIHHEIWNELRIRLRNAE